MTLRDELAAVLGPGNDDATAYAQADSVLDIIATVSGNDIAWAIDRRKYGPYPPT